MVGGEELIQLISITVHTHPRDAKGARCEVHGGGMVDDRKGKGDRLEREMGGEWFFR